MTVTTETEWCVRFVGSYFSLITNVMAEDEEQAEENAIAQLLEQHGLDMETAGAFDIEAFDVKNGENS